MYLLDTTHCILLMNRNPMVVRKLDELGDVPVSTCVICRGELLFGAYKSSLSNENILNVKRFLLGLRVHTIDQGTADIYADMRNSILGYFGVRQRRNVKTETLGFKDNDLWIGAVAKQHGLTIVSADSDFTRLADMGLLSVEYW